MAEALKDAVEGVKNLAVSGAEKVKEPKPQKEKAAKKKKGADSGDGRPLELSPQPDFFQHRIDILYVRVALFLLYALTKQ